jgi:hypothetical protein
MMSLQKKILKLFNFTFFDIPIWAIFFFLLIFLLSTHTWIFSLSIFFGQNWDHQLTENSVLSKNFFYNSLYIWHDGYGSNVLSLNQIFLNFIIYILFFFLNENLAVKIFLFFLFIFGFIINFKTFNFDRSISKITNVSSIIFSLYYCFSPVIFNLLIAGSIYSWFCYFLIPTYVIYFRNYQNLNWKKKFLFYFVAFNLVSFLPYFILATIFSVFFFLNKKKINLNDFKTLVKIFFYILCANLYWIFPSLNDFSQIVIDKTVIDKGFFFNLKEQSFINIFSMSGFLDRSFVLKSLTNYKFLIYVTCFVLIFILLIDKIIKTKKNSKLNLFLLVSLFILIFFSKKYNPPFGNLYFIFDLYFSYFTLIFRSDQNYIPITFFIYFYLIFINLHDNKKILFLLLIISIVINSSGDFGSRELSKLDQSHIRYFKSREPMNNLFLSINSNINGKFIIIPSTSSPLFVNNFNNFDGNGSLFELNLFDHASILNIKSANKFIFIENLTKNEILINNLQGIYLVKEKLLYYHETNFPNYTRDVNSSLARLGFEKFYENDYYIHYKLSEKQVIIDYDSQEENTKNKFELIKINKIFYKTDFIYNIETLNLVFWQKFSKNWCVLILDENRNMFKNLLSGLKCSQPYVSKFHTINNFKISETKSRKFKLYIFNYNQLIFYVSIFFQFFLFFFLSKKKIRTNV